VIYSNSYLLCDECKGECIAHNGLYVCKKCGLEHGPVLVPSFSSNFSNNYSTSLSSEISINLPLICITNKEKIKAKFYNIGYTICQIARISSIVLEDAIRRALKTWRTNDQSYSNSFLHVFAAIIYSSTHMGPPHSRLPEEWDEILKKIDLRKPGRNSANGDHRPIKLMQVFNYIHKYYGKLPDRGEWYWGRLSTIFPKYLVRRASLLIERPRNLKEAILAIAIVDYNNLLKEEDYKKIGVTRKKLKKWMYSLKMNKEFIRKTLRTIDEYKIPMEIEKKIIKEIVNKKIDSNQLMKIIDSHIINKVELAYT
jgi:arsenate reductase-like glutaredoxin family protein